MPNKKNSIKEVFTPEFETYLSGEKVTLRYKKDGIWHAHPGGYGCTKGEEVAPETRTLSELISGDICSSCLQSGDGILHNNMSYAWVQKIVDIRKNYQALSKIGPDTNAPLIQKKLSETIALLNEMEHMKSRAIGLENFFDELEEQAKDLLKSLNEITLSSKAKAQLENQIKKKLLPKGMDPLNFDFDPTMVLIGIFPAPQKTTYSTPTDDMLQAILAAYSIRGDKAVVLCAPAYFQSYLLGVTHFSGKGQCLVVSADIPDDAEALENGILLWDPQSNGPLANLSGALASGQALAG